MKRKTGLIILFVVLGIAALFFFSLIGSYNGLVNASEQVDQLAGDIQADLQRRSDLVPNLVATVQGYASHEQQIYTDIAQARSQLMNAGNLEEAAQADAELTSALSRLLVVVENYPELKADQNFLDLQTQLEGTENRIKVARTKYNEAVRQYNVKIRRFPTSVLAGMFGFDKKDYFEASAGAEQVPEVNFG